MTNNPAKLAESQLLERSEISSGDISNLLGRILSHDVDSGELFFQSQRRESWSLEEGIVKNAAYGVDRGMGVRAISGEKTGFAYVDDIDLPAIATAADAARSIASRGGDKSVAIADATTPPPMYQSIDPIKETPETEKVELLSRIDKFTRALDPCVKQVDVSIATNHDTFFVVSSDGTATGDVQPLVRFGISVIVERNGRRERGSAGGGGRHGLQWLFEPDAAEKYAREAVRIALLNLEAVDAPAGTMPVVLGPGWPGVLLHEAVGHGLEGDFNRKKTSAFSDRVGEKVASELCTVIDDATIPDRRGSLSVDDEGTAGQRTVLIEKGVLRGYLQDKLNARLMGVASTGNGRRQSYAHLPMPRMTNTFMLSGSSERDEILSTVSKGVYAVNFAGGQVDITSGQFVFSTSEAYLIENGKVTAPIRGATLIGNGPDVMTRVSMVGDDLQLDEGMGTCGKDGQSVPVGVGQPTLKVDELTVGGTSA